MLILFDIDATLITTARCGIEAMGLAGRALFGPSFDEGKVTYAGRLDPLIIRELLDAHGQPSTAADIGRFRDAYREHLTALFGNGWHARACPGVHELLGALDGAPGLTLGLLTGNYPETGAIKLRACGVDPDRFRVRVWGDDSPHDPPARDHLPPVAFRRFEEALGRRVEPGRVTIIGDTPHDIGCARAHGCRSLGVATGQFSVDDLTRAGADRAVRTLESTQEIAAWLMNA